MGRKWNYKYGKRWQFVSSLEMPCLFLAKAELSFCFLPGAAVLFPGEQRGTSLPFSKSGLYGRVYCLSLHHTWTTECMSCHIRQRLSWKRHNKCIVVHLFTFHRCVFKSLCGKCVRLVQGHSGTGEVQDHYNSLLQRSHGEAEHASPALCVCSVLLTDS